MAVNPKLIMAAVDAMSSEKGRKTILYVIVFSLGAIMMILVAFTGFISGLLDITQTSDLTSHWRYVRNCLSSVFDGMEAEINDDVKSEVYDFMPEFSTNLSKAAINSEFDGSSLILYDHAEISEADKIMKEYAADLRVIDSEDDFEEFIAKFDDTDLTYSDITNVKFAEDTDIDGISDYGDNVKSFLYSRAMEKMPQYEYLYEETKTEDGIPCTVQTLNVTDSDGETQTVEYICEGGGSIYLPHFLAMYNVRQSNYLIKISENDAKDESLDAQIVEAVGNIPETAEAAEEYLQNAWQGITDGKGAIKLNVFQTSNLTSLLENSVYDGDVSITTERTENKLTITLKSPSEDIWTQIFDIDENLAQYVDEAQQAIELALEDAEIPEEEWTLSIDNMVQAALFVYFEGFFELPVDSSDLAYGTNGIVSQCGEISEIHKYRRGSMEYNAPETGVTLNLESGTHEVRANLLDCGNCIQEVYIYDVWDMENGGHIVETQTESRVYNYSAVTLAYVIDTEQFEDDYGFPFPKIDGVSSSGTITLFVEFSCLDSLADITENDIGLSLYDICNGDITVGYSHDGTKSSEHGDNALGSASWYHSFPVGETVPHVCVKTSFMSGEVSVSAPNGVHSYGGLSVKDLGVEVNPRLWFKGFRTGMSEELFDTISAVQP